MKMGFKVCSEGDAEALNKARNLHKLNQTWVQCEDFVM